MGRALPDGCKGLKFLTAVGPREAEGEVRKKIEKDGLSNPALIVIQRFAGIRGAKEPALSGAEGTGHPATPSTPSSHSMLIGVTVRSRIQSR